MESTLSSVTSAVASNATVAVNTDSASCYLFTNAYFEIDGSAAPYNVNATVNAICAIVATLANILVFSVIRKTTSLHLPSKMLLCSLILTDLGVGLVSQPSFAVFLIAKANNLPSIRCSCTIFFAVTTCILSSVSLVTITAISLDRYIAFCVHLRYREIVTAKRVCLVLVALWSFGVFYGCTWVWNTVLYSRLALVTFSVSFLVTSLAYTKIYRGLRNRRKLQMQDHGQVQIRQDSGSRLDLVQYRRSTSNMLWIYGLFIMCYLPYLCAMAVRQFVERTAFVQCILEFTVTIMLLNSCLNPFLYCFRLPEIRAEVLQTLRKIGGRPQQ